VLVLLMVVGCADITYLLVDSHVEGTEDSASGI
jgi:hypothetical protein